MMQFIFLLKKFFNKVINRTHLVNEISVQNKSIQFLSYPIIDLEKKWHFENQKVELISYEGDSMFLTITFAFLKSDFFIIHLHHFFITKKAIPKVKSFNNL